MQTATDHTCDTEYDEPCIACALERGLKLRQFGAALNAQTAKRSTRVIELDWLDNFEDEDTADFIDPRMPLRPRLRIEYPNKMCVDLLPHIVRGTLQRDHWVLPADPAAPGQKRVVTTVVIKRRMEAKHCKVRILED